MRAWLRDPAAVKPGTPMPKIGLSDKDLDSIAAYMASLK
jgi:cytochrome c oxidase subunit 2